jgi:hypothetical protein
MKDDATYISEFEELLKINEEEKLPHLVSCEKNSDGR